LYKKLGIFVLILTLIVMLFGCTQPAVNTDKLNQCVKDTNANAIYHAINFEKGVVHITYRTTDKNQLFSDLQKLNFEVKDGITLTSSNMSTAYITVTPGEEFKQICILKQNQEIVNETLSIETSNISSIPIGD
jgi:hypothetical protein